MVRTKECVCACACVCLLAALLFFVQAETGTALIATSSDAVATSGVRFAGDIVRIDLKDGTVVKTTGKIGHGQHARFSPDGKLFAYLKADKKTVVVADLDGNVEKEFTAAPAVYIDVVNGRALSRQ